MENARGEAGDRNLTKSAFDGWLNCDERNGTETPLAAWLDGGACSVVPAGSRADCARVVYQWTAVCRQCGRFRWSLFEGRRRNLLCTRTRMGLVRVDIRPPRLGLTANCSARWLEYRHGTRGSELGWRWAGGW